MAAVVNGKTGARLAPFAAACGSVTVDVRTFVSGASVSFLGSAVWLFWVSARVLARVAWA